MTPVYCYTNYPTAELFVNGKSQGRITKKLNQPAVYEKGGRITDENNPCIDRYRLRWNNVKYEPGEMKVIVYDKDGKEVGTKTVRTAGKATSLQLTGENFRKQISKKYLLLRHTCDIIRCTVIGS